LRFGVKIRMSVSGEERKIGLGLGLGLGSGLGGNPHQVSKLQKDRKIQEKRVKVRVKG
jgi:hypothetical protein